MDFTGEEAAKVFPDVKPASDNIELKKQMGLSKEKYTKKQIDKIYQVAMDKIIETKSKIDVFDYIRLSNKILSTKKNVKDPHTYLLDILKNDYDNKLNQINLFEQMFFEKIYCKNRSDLLENRKRSC